MAGARPFHRPGKEETESDGFWRNPGRLQPFVQDLPGPLGCLPAGCGPVDLSLRYILHCPHLTNVGVLLELSRSQGSERQHRVAADVGETGKTGWRTPGLVQIL